MAKELEVVVVSASSLKLVDRDEKVDPMVVLEFQGRLLNLNKIE